MSKTCTISNRSTLMSRRCKTWSFVHVKNRIARRSIASVSKKESFVGSTVGVWSVRTFREILISRRRRSRAVGRGTLTISQMSRRKVLWIPISINLCNNSCGTPIFQIQCSSILQISRRWTMSELLHNSHNMYKSICFNIILLSNLKYSNCT